MDPDDLLTGFDISDEDSREFLSSLISSGQVPQADMDEILKISLDRGFEEMDMVFGCAGAVRDRFFGAVGDEDDKVYENSLLPFVGLVLSGQTDQLFQASSQAGDDNGGSKTRKKRSRRDSCRKGEMETRKSAKRRLSRSISHFWDEEGQGNSQEQPGRHAAADSSVVVDCPRRTPKDESPGVEYNNKPDIDTASLNFGCNPDLNQPDSSELSPPAVDVKIEQDSVTLPDPAIKDDENTQNTSLNTSSPTQEKTVSKPQRVYKSPFFNTPTTPQKKEDQATAQKPSSSPAKTRPPRGTVSSLPIPPLSAERFGLIQEELADDPFRLLIAITFLIRTSGKFAIPVFRELMGRFPTPEAIVAADAAEITALLHPLGLSVRRTVKIQKYARLWLESPPCKERRYLVKNYPRRGDGEFAPAGQEFGPEPEVDSYRGGDDDEADDNGGEDATVRARTEAIGCAWEIGHLTQGRYALDSWRIFCRDLLLGRAEDWKGKGRDGEFQPEWMRTLPEDKELRACLRWMWMREGWEWDPLTGEREPLRDELRCAVDEGRVGYDDCGNLVILS